MKRRWTSFLIAMLVAPAAVSAQEREPQLPSWMAGCWQMRDGERWAEECWTIPRGGQMLGSGRTGNANGVRSFEFMRIELHEPNGEGPTIRMAFVAAPNGMGWTTFAWSPSDASGVTFFNAANDYPQRVRYWREGDELKAEISLLDGSNPTQFAFRRMSGG